jgi:hypothetical protein
MRENSFNRTEKIQLFLKNSLKNLLHYNGIDLKRSNSSASNSGSSLANIRPQTASIGKINRNLIKKNSNSTKRRPRSLHYSFVTDLLAPINFKSLNIKNKSKISNLNHLADDDDEEDEKSSAIQRSSSAKIRAHERKIADYFAQVKLINEKFNFKLILTIIHSFQ